MHKCNQTHQLGPVTSALQFALFTPPYDEKHLSDESDFEFLFFEQHAKL